MTTITIVSDALETSDEKSQDDNAIAASVLTSLFRSLAGTWTHELRMENATTVNLPTIGHGFCSFTPREATKIKELDNPAGSVEELLVHENGDYRTEHVGQATTFASSVPLLWSRNFVWRMDFRGSTLATVRPHIEKRRTSSIGRKGSVFGQMSNKQSKSLSEQKRSPWRRMSTQFGKAIPWKKHEEDSILRRMSVPILRRISKAEAFEIGEPLRDMESEDVHNGEQVEDATYLVRKEVVIPQIDIYATKRQSRQISFHLQTLKFDMQPDVWRQRLRNLEDIEIEAYGGHFTGEERYGTRYEFVMRWEAPSVDNSTGPQYYTRQWSTFEVVRGPADKDKTTTTHYKRAGRSK